MTPPPNSDALLLKLGFIEVGAFGYAAMAVLVILAVLFLAAGWFKPRA